MTRLEILVSLSNYFNGIARPARLVSSDVQYRMMLYAREYIRHRLKHPSSDFDAALKKRLQSDVHDMGNSILVKLDKEKKEGGYELKQQIAVLILENKIIEKPILKQYKTYFRRSKLSYIILTYYNHAVLLNAVVAAFLYSLVPENIIQEQVITLDLGIGIHTITDNGLKNMSLRDNANHYIMEELEKVGMNVKEDPCRNTTTVDYLHFSLLWGTSYQFAEPRLGLLPYLTGQRLNPLQSCY